MDEFTVNDDLTAYSTEEIADLIATGNARLDALLALTEPSRDDLTEAERVFGLITALSEEQALRNDTTSRWAALRNSRVEASTQPDQPDQPDEDEEADEEAPEPPEQPDEAEQPEAAPNQPAPVQAAARPSNRAALARRTTRPRLPEGGETSRMVITAAADVPDFATGAHIDTMVDVGTATINRMRGFPEVWGIEGAQMQKYPVASFRTEFPEQLVMDKTKDDMDVLDFAAKESRLPGGSLTAAGGWCAPSETLYDFCTSVTTDGLVSLPEVNARRGGIRYTPGPDFSAIYSGAGFCQTEAQAIAGTAKTCYTVPCPSFTEVRLDACGMCIKVPILTQAGYPELVAETISQAMVAHQHKMSVKAINAMVSAASTAVAVADLKSVASGTLDAVELVANTTRQNYRMGFNETLELVAPFWLRGAIRADLANRNGVDFLSVTDAQIDGYFRSRGVNPQFVYNWQPLVEGEEGYPSTVQVLVYPAGTFVKATNDIINLSAVYDAASLAVNEYIGLFMEEGIAVVQRCFKAKLVTIPVCAGGITGSANNTNCFTLTP